MKTLRILFFLTLFALAACNGSSSPAAPDPEVATLKTQVQDLTLALAAATHADAQKFSNLQIIGQVRGPLSMDAGRVVNAINFGPCANMGTLQGKSGGPTTMTSPIETFQTCMGYEYSVNAIDGTIQPIAIEFDGPGCSGNPYVTIGNINSQVAAQGAVFVNPVTHTYEAVSAGSQSMTPVIVSFSDTAGNCTNLTNPGTDTVFKIVANDASISGVPNSSITVPFSIGAP